MAEKKAIFPGIDEAKAHPPGWKLGGVPLFWAESKSQSFWESLLDALAEANFIQETATLAPASSKKRRIANPPVDR
ncbi:MAG: hypothetical protein B7Z81_10985 [Acidocella sp. 20-61-6]|nr:MAG: hypothetical protein B7Z81_10985 [Acidocella sp. 20-61-6]